MKRLIALFLILTTVMCISVPSVLADPAVTTETIWLDCYDPDSHPEGDPPVLLIFPEAQGTMILESGLNYSITVEGTWSAWLADRWIQFPPCPYTVPEPLPMYPSPTAPVNGMVGLDAEYMFSWPTQYTLCDVPAPSQLSRIKFSLDGGNTFNYIAPVSDAYNIQHVYSYMVQGDGFPLIARLMDNGSDNYGQFRIDIAQESPGPGPQPETEVGGYIFQNKIDILIPWMAMAVTLVIGGVFILRKRKA